MYSVNEQDLWHVTSWQVYSFMSLNIIFITYKNHKQQMDRINHKRKLRKGGIITFNIHIKHKN